MSPRLTSRRAVIGSAPPRSTHLLVVVPSGEPWPDAPGRDAVRAAQSRSSTPPTGGVTVVQLATGQLVAWVAVDPAASTFDRHTAVRRAVAPLVAEHPARIDISLHGSEEERRRLGADAVYVVAVNATPLTVYKRGPAPRPVGAVTVHGVPAGVRFEAEWPVAAGNALCRELTAAPANLLGPAAYRSRLAELAREHGWRRREWDVDRLERMGAGAFAAVARGSDHRDAAVVRLTYDGRSPRRRSAPSVALVGKGICFDTGGHNMKSATHMNEMHMDMGGSAVVVGALLAATQLGLPIRIDAWLAISHNHISPSAYTQNEVVTALDGTTIEITHTDAEGRMVLADTLTLAARERPEAILDFATLTGSMVTAVGTRMSGVIGNHDALVAAVVDAGHRTGERLVSFPMPADYDESLESKVADVKQCVLETGDADHLLAARFLHRFVDGLPWAHVDLSAVVHKGGLGAVTTDVTGFGVALAVELLRSGSLPGGSIDVDPSAPVTSS